MNPQPVDAHSRDRSRTVIPQWMREFMRVSLPWKLAGANGVVLWVSLLVWGTVTAGPAPLSTAKTLLVLGALMAGSALINGLLVALALKPVTELEKTAQRVRAGDWSARASRSTVADPGLERLRLLVNEILDEVVITQDLTLLGSQAVQREDARERGQLSDEIFSDAAQDLAAILIQLQLLERGMTELDAQRFPKEQIRTVLENLRGVARRLRPPELDELGVAHAVQAHLRLLEDSYSRLPEILLSGEFPDAMMSPEGRDVAFRVVQEALSNSLRHSGASQIEINFATGPLGAVVTISDNGQGFVPRASSTRNSAGLGLLAMSERARAVGATLDIRSTPTTGTTISLDLPRGLEASYLSRSA